MRVVYRIKAREPVEVATSRNQGDKGNFIDQHDRSHFFDRSHLR